MLESLGDLGNSLKVPSGEKLSHAKETTEKVYKAYHCALVSKFWNGVGGLLYIESQQVLNLILYRNNSCVFGIDKSSEGKLVARQDY